jgi:uncharacterized protein with HEPN domain
MLAFAREVRGMIAGVSYRRFLTDRTLMRAVERSVELIGEAARRVSPSLQAAHTGIPWRRIIGLRNILAHEYGRVDYEMLYKSAVGDVPQLIRLLEKVVKDPGQ